MLMSASKKSRQAQRSHYRVAMPKRSEPPARNVANHDDAQSDVVAAKPQHNTPVPAPTADFHSTRPVAAVAPPDGETEIVDAPTVILTPNQIAALAPALPLVVPDVSVPGEEGGYAYLEPVVHDDYSAEYAAYDAATEFDAPTIVLDVAALMATPPPATPDHPAASFGVPPRERWRDESAVRPASPAASMPAPARSWPRPPQATPPPPVMPPPASISARTARLEAPDEEFARLREQRLARQSGQIEHDPAEPYISDKLRQWWHEIQPGIDRVLGRSHRGGARNARATSYHTSAQLPVVRVRSLDEAAAPSVQRLSTTARQIGTRAQTAALPALTKFHTRAERAAQQLVDRLDEHLGGRPPMQHVLLGPGRMIVSFAANVSIREAQIIINSVQARSLRRLVGYNAYLVLVPPGREAIYAERFNTYREITGVHFGPQRASSATGKLAPGR